MAVSLTKGGNISLAKSAPGMTRAFIGLGWDARTTDGSAFDLDASAILCGADGKALNDANFIFYNQLSDPSGAVVHQGDNRTGAGDGDDEVITVDLSALPAEVERIVIPVSIHDSNFNFGMVSDAYIRVFDGDDPNNNDRVTRYDLGEDAANENSMVFGELYKRNGEWKFKAIGQGYSDGLAGIVRDYGISAS